MNHFLVSVLGYVNGALAVAIILIGADIGGNLGVGGITGGLLGLGVAAVVCGLLAIAISIEKSLKHIAEKMPRSETEKMPRPEEKKYSVPRDDYRVADRAGTVEGRAALRDGWSEHAVALVELGDGAKVRVLGEQNGWVHVKVPGLNDIEGWVQAGRIR